MKALMLSLMMAVAPMLALADEQLRAEQFGLGASAPARTGHKPEGWDEQNMLRQRAEMDRMQRSDEDVRAKAHKACGEDFGMPRVGMTLDRARQCLGYAKLVGQVNRADGVASVYTNGRVQLVVMDGKVVAWKGLR